MVVSERIWVPDTPQMRVIQSSAKAIRVVGLAGSGKTQTLAERIQTRLRSGADCTRTLVIAFDEAGKANFTRKLRELDPSLPLPIIDTLDSLGGRILRELFRQTDWIDDPRTADEIADTLPVDFIDWKPQYNVRNQDVFFALGTQGYFGPLSESDRLEAAGWLYREYFFREWALLGEVERGRRVQAPNDAQLARVLPFVEAYDRYDQILRERRLLGREDQRLRALELLLKTPAAAKAIQRSTDEIVVDECQDLNKAEVRLLREITGPTTRLILAGDDDQTVYAFRQSRSLFLRQPRRWFGREFDTYELQTNYRCPRNVLAPATRLIRHNVERIDKNPRAHKRQVGSIVAVDATRQDRLDRKLANRIRARLVGHSPTGDYLPRDIAVLVENQIDADRITRALTALGVPADTQARFREDAVDAVEVLPVRLAKGREWKMVVLPGIEDATVPGLNPLLEEYEDARRLLYMAMTRASERLLIGFTFDELQPPVERRGAGRIVRTNGPSRLLYEARVIKESDHPQKRTRSTSSPVVDAPPAKPTSLVDPPAKAELTPLAGPPPSAQRTIPDQPHSTVRKAPVAEIYGASTPVIEPKRPAQPSLPEGIEDDLLDEVVLAEPAIELAVVGGIRERMELSIRRLHEGDIQMCVLNAGSVLDEIVEYIIPRRSARYTLYQRLSDGVERERITSEEKQNILRLHQLHQQARTVTNAALLADDQGREMILGVLDLGGPRFSNLNGLAPQLGTLGMPIRG